MGNMGQDFVDILGRLACVIVTYKMDYAESITYISLLNSLRKHSCTVDLFIYDNSPTPRGSLPNTDKEFRVHYLQDPSNPGISKAYNRCTELANRMHKDWIVFFDQDTRVSEDSFLRYTDQLISYPNVDLFVPVLKSGKHIVSPCRYFFKSGFLYREPLSGLQSIKHKTVLNSGMLISLAAYGIIGGFNEEVGLYFSDFHFIDKYRKKYRYFVVIDTVFEHEMADIEDDNPENSLERFKLYCRGAVSAADNWHDYLIFAITVLYRSMVLGFRFRSSRFIFTYFNIFWRR